MTKYLLLAALGVAAVLLFTTDKGEEIREDLMDNAGKWKDRVSDLAGTTGDKLADLKSLVSSEVEGLGKDARKRIMNIIDESSKSAKKLSGKAVEQFS
jgi:gas vesicle protein